MWAHIMWQKYRIRVIEWLNMSAEERIFYIASEQVSRDYPIGSTDRLVAGFLNSSKK